MICAGGNEENGPINKCEKYSIKKDDWKELPDLKEEKFNLTLCNANDLRIFSIGGCNKVRICFSTIELLIWNKEEEGWKEIILINNQCKWIEIFDRGSFQIVNNQIKIF